MQPESSKDPGGTSIQKLKEACELVRITKQRRHLFLNETLPSSNLVQMERNRRSNSLFCCGFLSRSGFFPMTPSRIRLLIIALSDDL